MTVFAYIQSAQQEPTTLSEIKRVHDWIRTEEFFGLYAYATQSGVSSFGLVFGDDFWANTQSRWLFGIDYGRTHPQAIRHIAERPNAEVRIHDGAWVVGKNGFLPRRDFHAKSSLLANAQQARFAMVVGSGNFSSNGLRRSVEAGVSLQVTSAAERDEKMAQALEQAETLWAGSTVALDIIDAYEEVWSASFYGGTQEQGPVDKVTAENVEIFWIEAGYVTKNRGPHRPGNQIDFPKGMSRYFGFDPPENLAPNSIIGPVTFRAPLGDDVTNNLRLGNNMMEKISLPIPETHGFDIYDGKVLVFQRAADHFEMRALEVDDFDAAFGDRLSGVQVMTSGRRFGHIAP